MTPASPDSPHRTQASPIRGRREPTGVSSQRVDGIEQPWAAQGMARPTRRPIVTSASRVCAGDSWSSFSELAARKRQGKRQGRPAASSVAEPHATCAERLPPRSSAPRRLRLGLLGARIAAPARSAAAPREARQRVATLAAAGALSPPFDSHRWLWAWLGALAHPHRLAHHARSMQHMRSLTDGY
jgi:hypothetical protein